MSWDTQILDAQQRIADLLLADIYINGNSGPSNNPPASKPIDVVTWKVGDISAAVRAAVGKVGIVISVGLPSGTEDNVEIPEIALTNKFAIFIIENPVLNRTTSGTQKPAEQVMLHAMKAVHNQPVNPAIRMARTVRFRLDKNAYTILRPMRDAPDRPPFAPLNYSVNINAKITL